MRAAALTVTAQVALKPPSSVVTVIVVLPTSKALSLPLLPIVATDVSELVHVSAWFVAYEGVTVANSQALSPSKISSVAGSSETPVTACTSAVTSMVQLAVNV